MFPSVSYLCSFYLIPCGCYLSVSACLPVYLKRVHISIMLSTIYYNSLSTFIIVNSSSVFTTVEQFDVNSKKLCLTKFLHSLNTYKCIPSSEDRGICSSETLVGEVHAALAQKTNIAILTAVTASLAVPALCHVMRFESHLKPCSKQGNLSKVAYDSLRTSHYMQISSRVSMATRTPRNEKGDSYLTQFL
jgi:hypothetical protein